MGYKELVRTVQRYSGFSQTEAKDALEMLVESISVHLDESERLKFARKLPERLQDISLSVLATAQNSSEDILSQFMAIQKVSRQRAAKQIKSAWHALKENMGAKQVRQLQKYLNSYTPVRFS